MESKLVVTPVFEEGVSAEVDDFTGGSDDKGDGCPDLSACGDVASGMDTEPVLSGDVGLSTGIAGDLGPSTESSE